jgi:hypothetical protein
MSGFHRFHRLYSPKGTTDSLVECSFLDCLGVWFVACFLDGTTTTDPNFSKPHTTILLALVFSQTVAMLEPLPTTHVGTDNTPMYVNDLVAF